MKPNLLALAGKITEDSTALSEETERGMAELKEMGRKSEALQDLIGASEFRKFVLPFVSSKPGSGLISEIFK